MALQRLSLACLLLLLAVMPAEGQNRGGQRSGMSTSATVTGRVLDSDTGDSIASATVAVWRSRDESLATGAVTENNGVFTIEGLRGGRYYIVISFVGYASKRIDDVEVGGETVDLGTIEIEPDVAALGEVQVAANRAQVQVQIDRTVYNTADDPASAGGTATTVLETIPSVDVDVDGNISLRGSGNVAVLINGRPAPVSADFLPIFLQQLPAGSIEKVEVMPNPSAKFEPDGMGGIINIVLKSNTDLGLGGAITVGGDTQGGYNGNGLLTYGNGPLSMSASYGFRQRERNGGGNSFRINRYLTPSTFLDQEEDDNRSGASHFGNLSVDYSLSRQTTLTGSAQIGVGDDADDEFNTFLLLDDAEVPMLSYFRQAEELGTGWNADFRLGLSHNFEEAARGGRSAGGAGGFERGGWRGFSRGGGAPSGPSSFNQEHTLTVDARFNTSDNTDDETFTERLTDTNDLRELQQTRTDRNRQEGSFSVDYVRPLGQFRLETGYKGELESLSSDFFSETFDQEADVFAPDVNLNNVFDYDQTIHAVYGQLGRQVGPLGMQFGLRLESAQTTFTLLNTNEAFDNDYASLFPSAFFTYQVGDDNLLKANYSRRINRPRTRFLNPFPSFDDPLNIRVGNPALEPEYVNSFEVGYVRNTNWGSLTFSPYYRQTTNQITRFQRLRDDGVTVRTVENFDSSDSYGVELISAFEGRGLLAGLRGFASLEGYRVVTDGSNIDTDVENDAFGWGGGLNASYSVGNRFGLGDLTLQGNARYRAPRETEQGRIGAFTFINFALRQQLLNDRASLTLQLRDPFDLAGFSYTIDQPRIYQELERNWGAQELGLTFTYSIGQTQRRRDRDRGDQQGGGDVEDMDF